MQDKDLQQLTDRVTALEQQSFGPSPITHPLTVAQLKYQIGQLGGAGVEGRSHGNSLTSIASGQANVATNLNFQTNDFAVGVTWGTTGSGNPGFTIVTAGKYLVGLTIGYKSVTDLTNDFAIIKKNGTTVSLTQETGGANNMSVVCVDLLNLAVGDYLDFYAQTTDNTSGVAIDNGNGATGCFIAKQ